MKKFSPDWTKLFLLCLGLFIGGLYGMMRIEGDLIYKGEKFSVIGLELYYPKEKIVEIFSGLNDKVSTLLGYHLSYDFVFMAGCYPGIVCLCMMAAKRATSKTQIKALFILGFIQLIPWSFDIIENYLLLKWLKMPVIGDEFTFYRVIVYSKWVIAVSTALFAVSLLIGLLLKRKFRNP